MIGKSDHTGFGVVPQRIKALEAHIETLGDIAIHVSHKARIVSVHIGEQEMIVIGHEGIIVDFETMFTGSGSKAEFEDLIVLFPRFDKESTFTGSATYHDQLVGQNLISPCSVLFLRFLF